ncbi:MAG TPA: carboxypeptidase-like regulatory domain-containing protein, partial [Solirubrobacteraceae bacterium]|nr:carboxypeptidase-like regulatory domain-containing protein [Solirubrobacteraceae bacterium]
AVRAASLTGGSAGSATVRDSEVQLRDLSLPPGAALDVAVTVDVGCGAGAYPWSVQAKQANRFNGSPGNDFVLVSAPGDLVTTVTGACALRFAAQPQDARVGERLSTVDFDPSGPPISVELIDGTGRRVTSSSPAISLTLASLTGFGTLSGTSAVTGAAGLATFGDLSVGAPGTYRLQASSPGAQPSTSAIFTIQQVAVQCFEDVDCFGSLDSAASQVDAAAFAQPGTDAGFLQLSFNTGFRPDCAGYEEYSSDWAVVLGPDRQKRVTYTIDKRVMNASPNNGASFLQMCFAAPFTFATRAGAPPAEADVDGDGHTDWYYATLPDCGTAPCVASRRKDRAGNGVIEVRAPAGAEDPAYRP